MKKFFSILISAAMVLSFAACGTTPPEQTPTETTPEVTPETPTESTTTEPREDPPTSEGGYELTLITDVGTIDDKSFNQGAWEGVEKYAKENNKTYKYYKPAEKTDDAYLSAIDLAISGGAKVIVCPGFLFEPAVFQAQDLYPDVKFILVDGSPNDGTNFKTGANTYSIKYAEQQAGFMAGYATVKDGYRKLGFMGGMAVPAVVRYGYGFIQGADYAAKELAIPKDEIVIKYKYLGDFLATPEFQTEAAAWYQNGTEVIFAAAGGAGNSVMAAAETSNGKVIGVDVDQYAESDTVISSAMKELGNSVYDAIKAYDAGTFPGGKDAVLGAKENSVGLPMENSKWNTFAQADYDALLKKLADDEGGVSTNMATDTTAEDASKVPVELVKVELTQ